VAKTRAQRKAERRAREAQQAGEGKTPSDSSAQHDTQVPVSGDIAEIKAVEVGMAAGAPASDLETPDAPKVSRTERRAQEKEQRGKDKRRRADEKRRETEKLAKRQKQAVDERSRGRVTGFLASCWAELKRVQWPDRETLVQASAVTLIFVAVAAVYLGALDAAFSFLVDKLL
jgi:preprotein translocase subunit SecE